MLAATAIAVGRTWRRKLLAEARLHEALRHAANTIDLRGMRVEEGVEATEAGFDRAVRQHLEIMFILHGHGTGAMKQAIRQWLRTSPAVAAWRIAPPASTTVAR